MKQNIQFTDRQFLDGNIATFRGIDLIIYGEIQPPGILEAFKQPNQDDFLIDICEDIFARSFGYSIWIQSGEEC